MKKLFTVMMIFTCGFSYSQFYVPSGETIFTTSNGEITSKENVVNNGTIYSVEMNNSSAQSISGTGSMRYLKANNSSDISLSSSHSITNNGITLTSGKMILGSYNLTTVSVTNDGATRYIKTSGSGVLRMNTTTGAYTKFPIGNTTYNYVRIYNNNAAADTFSVRVQDTLYSNAGNSTGSLNNSVNRTWTLSKIATNSGIGVNIEFNWNSVDVNGTLTNAVLYEYNGTKWVKANGTQSVSGDQITVTGYTGTLSSKQFMVSSSLGATVSVAASACQNATGINATFTGSGGTAPYTFTYILNGGSNQTVTTTSGSSVTVSVSTTTAGNQVFALVDVSDANLQNTVSDSATINIKANSTSTQSANACGSYTWNGTTYTTSGTKTWTGTNAAGCDSVATLNLTINSATSSSVSQTACGSYAWHGNTYTTSGAYTWTGTNANNCDSVVTLNLTINSATSSSVSQTACGSYAWHGNTYTTSGAYTWTGTNANNCDSVVTLNLTINSAISSSVSQTACGSYAWHGNTYTTSGAYTWTGTNANNCDSVVTLNLTINSATSSSVPATACGSYAWHGNTYTTSGAYTWTGTNANNCDSVVTLNLTIKSASTSTTTITATGSYTWNGSTYSTSGTYTWTGTNAVGCDSVATLNLTINSSIAINNILNVCPYIGTGDVLTYTATVAGASSYTWSLPANTQLVGGQGTRTISIKILTGFAAQANKQIKVTPQGGTTQTIYLQVSAPSTPTTIVASVSDVCPSIGNSNGITYRIAKVAAATSYIWTAQSGTTTVTSVNGVGANDTAVIITFTSNFSSSNITVRAMNDCGVSGARSYTITRNNPAIGLISGPANACEFMGANTSATYSVAAVAGVTSYNWTLPAGVTNVVGQGASSISFTYPSNFINGNVSVYGSNGCGVSATRSISITKLLPFVPSLPDVINLSACPNRTYSYTLASMPLQTTSLNWTVPAGATIVSGQGTTSIVVSYPSTAVSGKIIIQGVNGCGVSTPREIAIKLPACPNAPGTVYTKAADLSSPSTMEVNIYPNPTSSTFKLNVIAADQTAAKVKVMDLQGRIIRTYNVAAYTALDMGADLIRGTYLIEVRRGNQVKTMRVVKY